MNDEARPNLEPIEKMIEGLGVGAVFGEPIEKGGVTVVPVAEVRLGFGFGSGSGRGRDEESEGAPPRAKAAGVVARAGGPPQGAAFASLLRGSDSNRCRT